MTERERQHIRRERDRRTRKQLGFPTGRRARLRAAIATESTIDIEHHRRVIEGMLDNAWMRPVVSNGRIRLVSPGGA